MSVRRAQLEIDSREFGEWIAYNQISPGGPERADARAALIACTVANATPRKGGRRYKIKDFLLNFGKQAAPVRRKAEDIKAKLLHWKGMYDQGRKQKRG